MAIRFSKERALQVAVPAQLASGALVQGDIRVLRCTYDLATDGAVTDADAIELGELPAGAAFVAGLLTVSATLGSSTPAIGTNAAHASNGQYRAAAVQTATNAPNLFGLAAAKASPPLTAAAKVYLTTAAASLPSAGTVVVDIIYSVAN